MIPRKEREDIFELAVLVRVMPLLIWLLKIIYFFVFGHMVSSDVCNGMDYT